MYEENRSVTRGEFEAIFSRLAGAYGDEYLDYSGRAMYGAKCFGIVVDRYQKAALMAEAEELGFANPKVDTLGLHFIVYWPQFGSDDTSFDLEWEEYETNDWDEMNDEDNE